MNSSKAAFLDRDGVLNHEIGDYVKNVEEFKLLPHVIHNLKQLYEAGFLLIVITNQGGIAKQLYDKTTLENIHNKLIEELNAHSIKITEIFYCPHHPISGNCLCRKPEHILVQKAISKYSIDCDKSFFIGDNQRDIDCAKSANVEGFLINKNEDWSWIVNKKIQN